MSTLPSARNRHAQHSSRFILANPLIGRDGRSSWRGQLVG